ncbi:hypothetical protein DFH94DRAFT_761100 [Russula ochroleuca]|jgi:hypothetical protein|uniref:Uncharacterized protein n=1 Tax=Russula ochroleuca TaxID=152965 RepID=A0A9P5MRL2_9AGAM|nr:hypothetical protein DFH94DRAFT_761100 [Russula ochroleuca]
MDSSPAATTTTTRRPYDKSAEFARLYYFFEKLTQPRLRERIQVQESSSSRETTTADGPFPEDIAPLLKNLSAILTKDEPEDGDALGTDEGQVSIPETPMTALAPTFATSPSPPSPPPSLTVSTNHAPTRPRRNTVAGSWTQPQTGPSHRSSLGQSVVHQTTRFPLKVKRYPFTFKLLLHKLYDLEDWAAKVQEVLAASQEKYRPLSSTPAANRGSGGGGEGGGARSPGSPGVTFTSSLFGTASSPPESPPARGRRALSISKTKANDIATRSGPGPGHGMTPRPPQPSRAVKKRIVNRRRSTNALGIGKMGDWIYDAAVSSIDAENVDAKGRDSLRRRKRVLSSVEFAKEERRCVGRDVTNTSF